MKRDVRVAAVKISSARRKAAWKFWAPQQSHLNFMTKGNKNTARKSGAPVKQKQNKSKTPMTFVTSFFISNRSYSRSAWGGSGRGGDAPPSHLSEAELYIKRTPSEWMVFFLCWRYLSSRAVSSQVLWAEASLTSVFGMGTGGPSP